MICQASRSAHAGTGPSGVPRLGAAERISSSTRRGPQTRGTKRGRGIVSGCRGVGRCQWHWSRASRSIFDQRIFSKILEWLSGSWRAVHGIRSDSYFFRSNFCRVRSRGVTTAALGPRSRYFPPDRGLRDRSRCRPREVDPGDGRRIRSVWPAHLVRGAFAVVPRPNQQRDRREKR